MNDIEIKIRKRVALTPMGDIAVMPLEGMEHERARLCAIRYSRLKKYPIVVLTEKPGQLSFKRVTADEAKTTTYPEMDLLKISDSHLFPVPRPMQQRVRMAASTRNRRGEVLLSCALEPGGIRVTRHPLTPDEIASRGIVAQAPKSSKYGLEKLSTQSELRFELAAYVDQMRLRQAVSTKGRLEGWRLRCRLQDDGITLLVVRLDLVQTGGAS